MVSYTDGAQIVTQMYSEVHTFTKFRQRFTLSMQTARFKRS